MKLVNSSSTTVSKKLSSINYDQVAAITTDNDGAVYVSGYTYRNLDGQINNGNWDAFITKYLPDGTKSWTNLLGGSDYDQAIAIKTGSDGAIYISGYTGGDMDGQTNNGSADVFITKYLPDGTKSWTNLLGGSEHDQFTSLTTDSDGAIYVSGYTYGDMDGQTNNGGADAFITKYLPDGTKSWTKLFEGSDYDITADIITVGDYATYPRYIYSNLDEETNNGIDDDLITKPVDNIATDWTKLFEGKSDDYTNAITTGSDGAVYISGYTLGNLDGQINNGYYDAFITKYLPDGTKSWTKLLGSSDYDQVTSLKTGSDGAIYISGYTYSDMDGQTNNGSLDVFITKYLPDGTNSWTKLLGSSDYDQATAMTTSSDGAIYISGSTGGDLDGQTNNGSADAFITKYLADGTKSWTKLLGGSDYEQVTALITGSDGAIYVSGYTYGDMDGQTNNGGGADAFITKYLADGTKSWTNLLGGSGFDHATALNTDSDGAIYVSGYTYGDLDGQTNNGYYDAFITKYLADGTKSWTKLLGGSDYDQDTGSDVVVCIDYPYINLDGQTNNGGGDAFLTKLLVNNISPTNTIALAVSPSNVTEDGTTNLVYTFTRTGVTTNALTVNYNVSGTANFNNDYTQIGAASSKATKGTITFAAGATTAILTIDPTADTTVESDETVALKLATGTGYTIGTTTAVTGTITNDDTRVTLGVSPRSVTEDGTTNLVYTFTRKGVTTNALTVNYNVSGTATFNDDYIQIGAASYTATTGTINFAAGATTATLTIDPTADTTIESNETVALILATGTGYTVGTSTAVTGTITNDDFPSINLSPNQTVVEGNTSPQSVTYTVTLSNPSTQIITVKYATANGTAISGLDYTSKSGTLTFAPGVTNQSFKIPILNNHLNEADETFILQLTAPTNAVLSANSTVSTTITDSLTASVTTNLPNNVENLTLIGTGAIDGTGNAGNNVITGNSANNTLAGLNGNDTLVGLNGNDTYSFVAKTALGTDTIIETTKGGIDTLNFTGTTTAINVNLGVSTLQTVNSNLKLILSANNVIENTTGGTKNDRLTGNTLNNTLNGGDGNDQLQGLEGNDNLWGGAGNDILNGGSGNDSLWGGLGNDILNGSSGNDILTGGLGDDILTGGVGNDKYLFQSSSVFATSLGIDYISDFEAGSDQIVLSKTTFNAITNTVGQALTDFAVVTDDEFVNASDARVVFSQRTGSLFYNQDGNLLGANAVFEFASLGNPNITLSSSNFSLIV